MNSGEAEVPVWSAHAGDWAEVQQEVIRPAALAVLAELSLPGGRLLDLGCGAGIVAGLAAERGATVTGLDASPALLGIARRRVPSGRFHLGDLEDLPFPGEAFTAVTAVNCLQHADDPARALAEAVRVTEPGGTLAIAIWDPAPGSDALTYLIELGGLLPAHPAGAPDLTAPGEIETLLTGAGLTPAPARMVPCPWEYANLDTALRGLLSTGPAVAAIRHSGRARVVEAVTDAISPCRRDDGSYLLSCDCRYVTATR